MLIKVKDCTKCEFCGKELTGRLLQEVSCYCKRCRKFYFSCGLHTCPQCGDLMMNSMQWAQMNGMIF